MGWTCLCSMVSPDDTYKCSTCTSRRCPECTTVNNPSVGQFCSVCDTALPWDCTACTVVNVDAVTCSVCGSAWSDSFPEPQGAKPAPKTVVPIPGPNSPPHVTPSPVTVQQQQATVPVPDRKKMAQAAPTAGGDGPTTDLQCTQALAQTKGDVNASIQALTSLNAEGVDPRPPAAGGSNSSNNQNGDNLWQQSEEAVKFLQAAFPTATRDQIDRALLGTDCNRNHACVYLDAMGIPCVGGGQPGHHL